METDDARSYVTFRLNPLARFSDGQPVLADDVLFSWQLLRDHGRPNHRQYYSKVVKAEALDPRTVRFDFGGANDRELPLILGLMPILPRHATDVATFRGDLDDVADWIGSLSRQRRQARRERHAARATPIIGAAICRSIAASGISTKSGWTIIARPTALFEAFKRGLYDFRVETEPLRWHDGYDFPAARDGEVIRDTIKPGDAATIGIPGVQHPAAGVCRHPRAEALTLLFDFEWINRNYFFGSLCALARLLRRLRIVGL